MHGKAVAHELTGDVGWDAHLHAADRVSVPQVVEPEGERPPVVEGVVGGFRDCLHRLSRSVYFSEVELFDPGFADRPYDPLARLGVFVDFTVPFLGELRLNYFVRTEAKTSAHPVHPPPMRQLYLVEKMLDCLV